MPARFSTNAKRIAGNFRRMAERVEPFQLAANVEIAMMLTTQSKENLREDVYSVPIKRSRTGRPLWKRTLVLYTQEGWRANGMSVEHVNAAPHYLFRLRYGRPGGRPASPPQRVWRGPNYVLAKNLRAIGKKRSEALRRSIRV